MQMRVSVTDLATREPLFVRQFQPRQRRRGLSIGSGDRDDIHVPGLRPGAMKVLVEGRHSFIQVGDEHVTTGMLPAGEGRYRVKSGNSLEVAGCRIEFRGVRAGTQEGHGKACFSKLFLTLVYELARMEHGAEAMLTEFDVPGFAGAEEPFEKWVFRRLEQADAPGFDVDELIRGVRRRFARLSALQLASFKTLQDCVDRVRTELDPSAIFDKANAVEKFFSGLGAWRRYLERYNGAFASSQRFYNEYVYPAARTNLLRQLESRKSIAVLKSAS